MLFLYVDLHGIPKLLFRLMVPNVFPHFSIPLIRSFSALRSRLMLIRESRQLQNHPHRTCNMSEKCQFTITPPWQAGYHKTATKGATEAANKAGNKYCTTSYIIILVTKIMFFNFTIIHRVSVKTPLDILRKGNKREEVIKSVIFPFMPLKE